MADAELEKLLLLLHVITLRWSVNYIKTSHFQIPTGPKVHLPRILKALTIWVRSRRCGCLVTWFCHQMIAKPGNKTAAHSWPDQYICGKHQWSIFLIRALGRHFLLRVQGPHHLNFQGPLPNMKGPSIEIHHQFSNFGGSIWLSGKISQGPHWIFKGPGPLPPGPQEPWWEP